MTILLTSETEEKIVIKRFSLTVDGETYIYKETVNEKGRVIDAELLDAGQNAIENVEMYDAVQTWLQQQGK